MIYLLIKVCVNKGLIRIKSIFITLKISYYSGKDKIRIKDRLIRKERQKEGCRSTRPPPSEGIETDSSLDRRPIPPPRRRVVPGVDMFATRVDPP